MKVVRLEQSIQEVVDVLDVNWSVTAAKSIRSSIGSATKESAR